MLAAFVDDVGAADQQGVDGADLGVLLAFWGTVSPAFPRADINGDGWVDLNDVQLYMQGAGQAPAGVDTTRGRPATRW